MMASKPSKSQAKNRPTQHNLFPFPSHFFPCDEETEKERKNKKKTLIIPARTVSHQPKGGKHTHRNAALMLSRDLIAGELLDICLGPIVNHRVSSHSPRDRERKEKTHISPIATMHTVCHTLRPIRGATPRYNPFNPFVW